MVQALWVIAFCEVTRAIQNAIQIIQIQHETSKRLAILRHDIEERNKVFDDIMNQFEADAETDDGK